MSILDDLMKDLRTKNIRTDVPSVAGIGNYMNPGKDSSGLFGLNGLIEDNENLFGLAGMGLDLWNGAQDRKEATRINDFNIEQGREKLAMTKNSYDNNLYRSNMVNDQMASGGVSKYQGRQYMNPNGQQATAAANTRANTYAAQPAQGLAASTYQKPKIV